MKMTLAAVTILLLGTQLSFATDLSHKAILKIYVQKTTVSRLDGHYNLSSTPVCTEQTDLPFLDHRQPTPIVPPYTAEISCASTIQGQPVSIKITAWAGIETKNGTPWDPARSVDVMSLGTSSYVDTGSGTIPPERVQESTLSNQYTPDLTLKEMGWQISPDLKTTSVQDCSFTPCKTIELLTTVEYFDIFASMENLSL